MPAYSQNLSHTENAETQSSDINLVIKDGLSLPKKITISPENYVEIRVWFHKDDKQKTSHVSSLFIDPSANYSNIFLGHNLGHISISIHTGKHETYISHLPGEQPFIFSKVAGFNSNLKDDSKANWGGLKDKQGFPDEHIILYSLDTQKMIDCFKELGTEAPWSIYGEDSSSSYVYKILEAGGLFNHLLKENERLYMSTMTPSDLADLVNEAKNAENVLYPETKTYFSKNLESALTRSQNIEDFYSIDDEHNEINKEQKLYKISAYYDQVLKINPESHAYFNRGVARLKNNDFANAIKDFNEAIIQEPNNFNIYYYRGNAKLGLNDLSEALVDYDLALKIEPNFIDALKSKEVVTQRLNDLIDVPELCLPQFTEEEIDLYLQQYAKSLEHTNESRKNELLDWSDWLTYKYYLTSIESLMELAKDPFTLKILVDVLPKVITKQNAYTADKMLNFRQQIYDQLIDNWCDIEANRILQNTNKKDELLIAAIQAKVNECGSEQEFFKQCIKKYIKSIALLSYKKIKWTGNPTLSNQDTLNPMLFIPDQDQQSYFQSPINPSLVKIIRSHSLLKMYSDGYRFPNKSLLEHLDKRKPSKKMFWVVNPFRDSLIEKHLPFDYNNWIVSLLLNPESTYPNHTFIVIEGQNAFGDVVLHRYDLSIIDKDHKPVNGATVLVKDKMTALIKDHYLLLHQILSDCDPKRVNGFSWRVSREQAKLLDRNIKKEEGKIFPFNFLGKLSIFSFSHNCYTWARAHLLKLNNPHINDQLSAISKLDHFIVLPKHHLYKKPDTYTDNQKKDHSFTL